MTTLDSKDTFNSFVKSIKEVKELDPKIFAVFLTDSDGMPVYEVGLFDMFSKDGGFSFCSFAAEILSALHGVDADLTVSPFDTAIMFSPDLNFQLFYLTDSIILGIISAKDANIGLIRVVVQDMLPAIRDSLNEIFG